METNAGPSNRFERQKKKKSANIGQAGRDYNPKEQEQKTERQTDNRKREKEDK